MSEHQWGHIGGPNDDERGDFECPVTDTTYAVDAGIDIVAQINFVQGAYFNDFEEGLYGNKGKDHRITEVNRKNRDR